jgi:NitT/TauT family transport system substrate-binding protein
MRTSVSRRAWLGGTAGLTALGGLSPILLSFDAAAAETINLTLPWIPEGEVAFMYAARKQGFWSKRGLDVTITRGFGEAPDMRMCVDNHAQDPRTIIARAAGI